MHRKDLPGHSQTAVPIKDSDRAPQQMGQPIDIQA